MLREAQWPKGSSVSRSLVLQGCHPYEDFYPRKTLSQLVAVESLSCKECNYYEFLV